MAGIAPLKSLEFRREREKTWRELEKLVARSEKNGIGALTAAELSRLPVLYRATVSSLSVARAVSLDKNVVHYLESLVTRAYFCVYANKEGFWPSLTHFILVRFPASVRALVWHLVAAAMLMAIGSTIAYVMVSEDAESFHAFVDPALAADRGPASSTEELRAVLYMTDHSIIDVLLVFASHLFTHNSTVGLLCFALGIVPWLPGVFFMVLNGFMLGAFTALYAGRGLGVEFWAWVLPHGVTELLALLLCGAASLALGTALLFPGRHTRIDSLAMRGKIAGSTVIGCVGLLFIAGMIEGIFRQMVTDVGVRLTVALATLILWVLYFGFVGRRSTP